MALVRLKDYSAHHQAAIGGKSTFEDFQVYASDHEQVGSVKGALVDEQDGHLRYLIVDTGVWFLGKQVLLPVGMARFDDDARRVYVEGLTQEQVEKLPEFNEELRIDQDYEESVRSIYRPMLMQRGFYAEGYPPYHRETYDYYQDSALYALGGRSLEGMGMYERQPRP